MSRKVKEGKKRFRNLVMTFNEDLSVLVKWAKVQRLKSEHSRLNSGHGLCAMTDNPQKTPTTVCGKHLCVFLLRTPMHFVFKTTIVHLFALSLFKNVMVTGYISSRPLPDLTPDPACVM